MTAESGVQNHVVELTPGEIVVKRLASHMASMADADLADALQVISPLWADCPEATIVEGAIRFLDEEEAS